MELSFNIVSFVMLWLLLPTYGLIVTEMAFLLGYVVYFLTVKILVRRIHAFGWQALSFGLLSLHVGLAIGLPILALLAPLPVITAALLLELITGLLDLRIVLTKIGPDGPHCRPAFAGPRCARLAYSE